MPLENSNKHNLSQNQEFKDDEIVLNYNDFESRNKNGRSQCISEAMLGRVGTDQIIETQNGDDIQTLSKKHETNNSHNSQRKRNKSQSSEQINRDKSFKVKNNNNKSNRTKSGGVDQSSTIDRQSDTLNIYQ